MRIIEEEWRDIKNFEGYYQVSNLGRVRSLDRYVVANNRGGKKLLKSRIMKLSEFSGRKESTSKYLVVNLRREGYNKVCQVHRLVAEAFIPNPDNLPMVNHKDGNKSNNNVENLEWCTCSYNNQHALDHHLRSPRGIPIIQCDLDGNEIEEYKSASEASRQTGLGRGSICHCLCGRQPSYAGYIWKYKYKEE